MRELRHDRTRIAARRAINATIVGGAERYDRTGLSRLIPVGPDEIVGAGPQATRKIVLMLARALRGERTRGRAGHWTYDLNRHLGLAQALRAERDRLESELRGAGNKKAAPGGAAP